MVSPEFGNDTVRVVGDGTVGSDGPAGVVHRAWTVEGDMWGETGV